MPGYDCVENMFRSLQGLLESTKENWGSNAFFQENFESQK